MPPNPDTTASALCAELPREDIPVIRAALPAQPDAAADATKRVPHSVSVVLPCLNEEAAVAATVEEALDGLTRTGLPGEVLVVDNGSTDRSVELAKAAGARIIRESQRGYGAAHITGMKEARGDVVVMADADQTYELNRLGDLLQPLTEGADLVVGSRLQGAMAADAMPFLHRHLGTPVITRMLSFLTGVPISDSQSGYRAFWRDSMLSLRLQATGMEYASEMLLKAGRAGLQVRDVPTHYRARVGESKLCTVSDGWRHILMLLLLSPHLSLLLPGAVCVALSVLLCALSFVAPTGIMLGSLRWLPVFLGPTLLIIGVQALLLGSFAAYRSPLTPQGLRRRLAFLAHPGAVNALLARCAVCALLGTAIDVVLLTLWVAQRSGQSLLGIAGLAQALIVIGICGICATFAAEYSRDQLGW